MELKTQSRNTWSDFFSSQWFVILLITAFFITVISLIIRALLPEEIPVQENTWNSITPGFSNYEQLVEQMGPPLDSVETEDGFKLDYQSDFLAIPNQVITDKTGTIEFIKEYLLYDPNHVLKTYKDLYGEPDLVLFEEENSSAIKANVFLEEGLVILAHITDGTVEQKWYFVPTTQDLFLASWGQALSEDSEGPELAN
jgi:hypothetical protein